LQDTPADHQVGFEALDFVALESYRPFLRFDDAIWLDTVVCRRRRSREGNDVAGLDREANTTDWKNQPVIGLDIPILRRGLLTSA
jgi:hypothetical protein